MSIENFVKFGVPSISLGISIIALGRTYYIQRKATNSQLIGDQLKKVIELIECINKTYLKVSFFHMVPTGGGAYGNHYRTLSIRTIEESKELENDFDDAVLIYDSLCNQAFDFLPFIHHPLVPKAIVRELSKFYSAHFQIVNRADITESQVVVIESATFYPLDEQIYGQEQITGKYLQGNAIACHSWLSFKESSHNLIRAVENWLKSKSVTDLDVMRDD